MERTQQFSLLLFLATVGTILIFHDVHLKHVSRRDVKLAQKIITQTIQQTSPPSPTFSTASPITPTPTQPPSSSISSPSSSPTGKTCSFTGLPRVDDAIPVDECVSLIDLLGCADATMQQFCNTTCCYTESPTVSPTHSPTTSPTEFTSQFTQESFTYLFLIAKHC